MQKSKTPSIRKLASQVRKIRKMIRGEKCREIPRDDGNYVRATQVYNIEGMAVSFFEYFNSRMELMRYGAVCRAARRQYEIVRNKDPEDARKEFRAFEVQGQGFPCLYSHTDSRLREEITDEKTKTEGREITGKALGSLLSQLKSEKEQEAFWRSIHEPNI